MKWLLVSFLWMPLVVWSDPGVDGPRDKPPQPSLPPAGKMNNGQIDRILKTFAHVEEGRPGYWIIDYEGRALIVITDESHNRMRIMTPVLESDKLTILRRGGVS